MSKDGGPAFPHIHTGTHDGMTLRDYFAAHAKYPYGVVSDMNEAEVASSAAAWAYQYADAMLGARASGGAA